MKSAAIVAHLKKCYPAGTRIKLRNCNDKYTRIQPGTLGTITDVDDVGTIHVKWDGGGNLGLCYDDGDRWEMV